MFLIAGIADVEAVGLSSVTVVPVYRGKSADEILQGVEPDPEHVGQEMHDKLPRNS